MPSVPTVLFVHLIVVPEATLHGAVVHFLVFASYAKPVATHFPWAAATLFVAVCAAWTAVRLESSFFDNAATRAALLFVFASCLISRLVSLVARVSRRTFSAVPVLPSPASQGCYHGM